MAEEKNKINKTCGNCSNECNGVCAYLRSYLITMTRVFQGINDITIDCSLQSAITITDKAKKEFGCNFWKKKELKEE